MTAALQSDVILHYVQNNTSPSQNTSQKSHSFDYVYLYNLIWIFWSKRELAYISKTDVSFLFSGQSHTMQILQEQSAWLPDTGGKDQWDWGENALEN